MTKLVPPGELEHQLKTRLATLERQRATKRAARKGSRGHAGVRLAGLTAVIGLMLISVSGVFAVHDENFQLEGNATAADLHHGTVCVDTDGDQQTPCIVVPAGNLVSPFDGDLDWDSLFNITGVPAPGNALGTVTGPKAVLPGDFTGADFQKDFKNSSTTFITSDDTTFATGSKDTLNITPGWQCNQDNNVNSKTDIMNGFGALQEQGSEQIFYFGLEKAKDNGNNNVGMWLLQDPTVGCTSTGSAVPFTGVHQVGDLLVVSAFTNGGGVSNIDVYQWNPGNATADDPLEKIGSGVDCLITGAIDSVCATVFEPDTTGGDDTLAMPWLTADDGDINAEHPSPNFYEGGINLSAFPQFANRCFTTFILDTRSSQSPTATLFDFVQGDIGICEPEIEVTKAPRVTDVCEGSGTSVTYDYTVENTGNIDLTNVDISDDTIPGAQAAFELANGGSDDIAEGAPPVAFSLTAVINTTTTNIVTVDADSIAGLNTASDTATATVTAHDCTIDITKTPDEEDVCAGSDTLITYTYEVTNNSDLFDAVVDVWDDAGTPGDATDDVLVADDLAVAAGATESFTAGFTVNVTTTNTATATATFNDVDSTQDTATADATVTAHDCTISLTKEPDIEDVCEGSDTLVTYTYVITNDSDFFNVSGTVTDDAGTPGDTSDDVVVGTFTDLAPGAFDTYTQGFTVNATTTNTATAEGTFDDPVSTTDQATADATVDAHDCTIDITKDPSETDVCNGNTVDYHYTVTNNSDLFDWTGDIVDDAGTPGDTADDVLIDDDVTIVAGATVEYDLTDIAITGEVTNTVEADGTFSDGTVASATADATVTGHICTITVTKSNPDDVCDGGEVTYDYTITNNSDEFVWTGTLDDDQLGDIGGTITLDPGETENFSANANITGTVTNIVTGSGTFNDPDTTSASDTATATVTSHLCTISITKTPSDTEVCNGDLVDYDYLVTNNSDEFTWEGDVVDDFGTPGDTTDDVTLATNLVLGPGASEPLELNGVVINGTVTNTVTATGSFDDPASTSANADAEATVVGTPCGGGCTPGFWQGGLGVTLWNTIPDPEWTSHGGLGDPPFTTGMLFKDGPWVDSGNNTVDNMTMLQIVGSGGTSTWARKAARDLIAAYLNASFGSINFPISTTTILTDWADAVADGTAGFRAFHDKYAPLNQAGCTIGQTT